MKISVPFPILLVGCASIAVAGGKIDPIDAKTEGCTSEATSTMSMLECENQAYDAWDARLNQNYQRVRGHLDAEGKKALQASQRDWLKHRDGEFQWMQDAYRKMQGTIYQVSAASTRVRIVRDRALQLQSFLETVEESH